MTKLSVPVFDAHCDTISRCLWKGEALGNASGMISLDRTEAAFSAYSQVFAMWADGKGECGPEVQGQYQRLLGCFREQMERFSERIVQCRTAEEAEEAHRQGKAAAFLSVEGGELLGCDPGAVEGAAAEGVVAVNLTWNHANLLSGSNCQDPDRGLTDRGREFVRELRRNHVLPDVSHLSEAGFWDVAEEAGGPILASHSNAKFIWNHTRNLTDDQITAIIQSQGVIGLNFFTEFVGGDLSLDTVRRHLDHMLSLGGEKTVALGGDWDGCRTIDALPTVDRLSSLYAYLLQHGYGEDLLEDLFANNLMRIVRMR